MYDYDYIYHERDEYRDLTEDDRRSLTLMGLITTIGYIAVLIVLMLLAAIFVCLS